MSFMEEKKSNVSGGEGGGVAGIAKQRGQFAAIP